MLLPVVALWMGSAEDGELAVLSLADGAQDDSHFGIAPLGRDQRREDRDVAQLGPPVVSAALLSLFALPSVFATAGIMMIGSAMLTRHIPRRL